MIGAEPVIEKRRWLSPVWLLPLIALLLAGGFLYQQVLSRGQLIQINFAQGNGILPGKTQVRYQGWLSVWCRSWSWLKMAARLR